MRLVTIHGADLEQLRVRVGDPMQIAMQRMNETGRTFLLVNGEAGELAGVLADGDIRRFLANGGATSAPVDQAINATPITLDASVPLAEVRAFMSRRGLEYLPLTDEGRALTLCILDRAPQTTDLSAVIIAGGLGRRLSPLTDDCPKPLLPLGSKPILSHILDHLVGQGIHQYVFSVSYLKHMIIDQYDDGASLGVTIDYVHETQRLGTGGPLSLIDPETLSDPFLCMNADVLSDIDIGALQATHENNSWDATMVVRQFTDTIPYGVIDADSEGRFAGMQEKPLRSYLVNAGAYMLSKSVLSYVPPGKFYDLPVLFEDLTADSRSCGTYLHQGRWIDVGNPREYERAQTIFGSRKVVR